MVVDQQHSATFPPSSDSIKNKHTHTHSCAHMSFLSYARNYYYTHPYLPHDVPQGAAVLEQLPPRHRVVARVGVLGDSDGLAPREAAQLPFHPNLLALVVGPQALQVLQVDLELRPALQKGKRKMPNTKSRTGEIIVKVSKCVEENERRLAGKREREKYLETTI